jgi:hypothetical protein
LVPGAKIGDHCRVEIEGRDHLLEEHLGGHALSFQVLQETRALVPLRPTEKARERRRARLRLTRSSRAYSPKRVLKFHLWISGARVCGGAR